MIYYKTDQYYSSKPTSIKGEVKVPSQSIEHFYNEFMKDYSDFSFKLSKISDEQLKYHKISIRHFSETPNKITPDPTIFKQTIYSIVQTQHFGLEYTYEIVIGFFKLKIFVLNLHRNSDDGEKDLDSQQIGNGSFGSVRMVKIDNKSFAIKRIPFQVKLDHNNGYDYDISKNQHNQIKLCLQQYCIYKICSLLGIGPRVISNKYDLTCFNNCIEFKMELCEPLDKNISFIINGNHKQIENDLSQRLMMLHSLNMVHRDIKPDNILYSKNNKRFVYGDFGMTSLIMEKNNQKSKTKFAGTPGYCGQQMSKLLNNGFGYVNLYHNDFESLKITLDHINDQIYLYRSQISRNSMSFFHQKFNSSSFNDSYSFSNKSIQQNEIASVSLSGSHRLSVESIFQLSTAHSLAPKEYSSSINHYESELIYEICRKIDRDTVISQIQIEKIINNCQVEYNQIFNMFFTQIKSIFLNDKISLKVNLIKQWKNSSRHFGPDSEETIKCLKDISQIADESQQDSINIIYKNILQNQIKFNNYEAEMEMYYKLKYYSQFVQSFVSMLRQQVSKKDLINIHQSYIQKSNKIAKYFLRASVFSQKINKFSFFPLCKLAATYFDITFQQKQYTVAKILSQIVCFCYNFLQNQKIIDDQDHIVYIQFSYTQMNALETKKIDNFKTQIFSKITKRIKQTCNYRLKVNLANLFINLKQSNISDNNKAIKFNQYEYVEEALNIYKRLDIQEIHEIDIKLTIKCNQAIGLFTVKKFKESFLKSQQCLSYIEELKRVSIGVQYTKFLIMLTKLQASYYFVQQQYTQSQKLYNQVLKMIQDSQTSSIFAKQKTECLNNLHFIFDRRKDYQTSANFLWDIVKIIQNLDNFSLLSQLIYAFQMLIRNIFISNQKYQKIQLVQYLINKKVNSMYQYFTINGSENLSCQKYRYLVCTDYDFYQESDKQMIHQFILKALSKKTQYQTLFHYQFQSSCRFLWIQLLQKQRYHSILKYVWKIRRNIYMIRSIQQFGQYQFELMITYVHLLMKCRSYRRALIVMQKFVYFIPHAFSNLRNLSFKYLSVCHSKIQSKMAKIFQVLIRDDYECLERRNYKNLMTFMSENECKQMLAKKIIAKLQISRGVLQSINFQS